MEQRAEPDRRPRFSRFLTGSLGVKVAALLTAGMGFVNLFAAVTPVQSGRLRLLESFSPLQVSREGHLASALAGFALLLLASALWRRKRVAWLLTLVVLVISMVVDLLKGLDYEEADLAVLVPCPIGSTLNPSGFRHNAGGPGIHARLRSPRFLPA
jgi:lysylphosphatidylglycerol synthetase-like protein (DUF2156 family)